MTEPVTRSPERAPDGERAVRGRVLLAATVRSFVTGLVGVALGIHLATLGFDAALLGGVVTAGLAGNALSIAVAAAAAERWGRRRTLVLVSALSVLGLFAIAAATAPAVLLGCAFLGMLNGMGKDRGAAQAIDQAILADRVRDELRTALFVRYTLLQDVAVALGSLALALAGWLQGALHLSDSGTTRALFALAAAAGLIPIALYATLRDEPESPAPAPRQERAKISAQAKRRIRGLSALIALDSLGGGFLAGAILSYWFFRRFGLEPEAVGAIFFGARALNALSYLAAGRLARRIGLVRTMVFTHLPSGVMLLALPLVEPVALAVALFLLRESLVQMDVPTRQSYIAAIVAPHERTFALATTSLVRYTGWAVGPALAGLAMAAFGLGAPLVAGAGLKIVYDLGLFAAFRKVRPPEEGPRPGSTAS